MLGSARECEDEATTTHKETSNKSSLTPTHLYNTAFILFLTIITTLNSHFHLLNYAHNTLIYYFVLYLADKASNTKIQTQHLVLLSSKLDNRE